MRHGNRNKEPLERGGPAFESLSRWLVRIDDDDNTPQEIHAEILVGIFECSNKDVRSELSELLKSGFIEIPVASQEIANSSRKQTIELLQQYGLTISVVVIDRFNTVEPAEIPELPIPKKLECINWLKSDAKDCLAADETNYVEIKFLMAA